MDGFRRRAKWRGPAPVVRTVENPTPGTNQGGLIPQRQVPAPVVARPELSGFIVTPEGKYLVPGFDSDEQHWFDVLIDSEIEVEPKYKGRR